LISYHLRSTFRPSSNTSYRGVRLPISASDAIQPAFRHAKEQLLRPFRFRQWARLAVVGLLAGEMGSFGGCNVNYPSNTQHRGSQQFFSSALPALLTDHPALFAGLTLALIVVAFGLLVLFTYISSVMRFILFDSIIARECHIRQGWARRKHSGFRLFLWRLLFMLATLAALLIVIGIPAACAGALGWFTHARDHVLALVLGGLALLFILLVLLVLVGVISVMTKDFVVPQMALEDISAMEGWRRLWLWIKYEKGGYAGYIGMKIVLAIGAAVALAIVTLIAVLILLIPIGGVGFAAVLGGKAAGWTWNPYTITLAVIFGCIALAIIVFMAALISVPVIVFFPAYSVYFFAPRYSQLASLLWPQPSAPAAPGQPPPEPTPS
jgi:hypothetical protein